MRTRHAILADALLVVLTIPELGQGAFQNLGFEAASVGYVPPGQFGAPVSVTAGLPAWSAFIDGVAQCEVCPPA